MRKVLLMSMLFLTIGIPAIAARDRNAHRGLRKLESMLTRPGVTSRAGV